MTVFIILVIVIVAFVFIKCFPCGFITGGLSPFLRLREQEIFTYVNNNYKHLLACSTTCHRLH